MRTPTRTIKDKKEYEKLYHQIYVDVHRKEINEYNRDYQKRFGDKEKMKKYHHEWYLKNREKQIEKAKSYYKKRKDKNNGKLHKNNGKLQEND